MPVLVDTDNDGVNDGYKFLTVKHQTKDIVVGEDGSYTIGYRPSIGSEFNSLLADGAIDNALSIVVRLTWIDNNGAVATQDFVFIDSLVEYVYSNKQNFTLKITSLGDATDVNVTVMLISDTGVESGKPIGTIGATESID